MVDCLSGKDGKTKFGLSLKCLPIEQCWNLHRIKDLRQSNIRRPILLFTVKPTPSGRAAPVLFRLVAFELPARPCKGGRIAKQRLWEKSVRCNVAGWYIYNRWVVWRYGIDMYRYFHPQQIIIQTHIPIIYYMFGSVQSSATLIVVYIYDREQVYWLFMITW